MQVSRIENGYRATFTFSDVGATVPVEITLQEDGIRAEIPGDEIQTGDEYSITSIELLPGFTDMTTMVRANYKPGRTLPGRGRCNVCRNSVQAAAFLCKA